MTDLGLPSSPIFQPRHSHNTSPSTSLTSAPTLKPPKVTTRAMSTPPSSPPSRHRARPRLTDQIQVIRELWLLREQARVQAAERCFLAELERLLTGRMPLSDEPPPQPPVHPHPVHSPVAHVPPPPPPPRGTTRTSSTTATFSVVGMLDDGHIYESHPPPRGDRGPARERLGVVDEEVERLRSRQSVTNLSPEFRALLEGNGPPSDFRSMVRSQSFGQLSNQRTVSSLLESEFRHQLEGMLVRRGDANETPSLGGLYNRAPDTADAAMTDEYAGAGGGYEPRSNRALEAVVRALRDEVQVLKNVMSASFDLQLDIQRSIRQEVSAAMNTPARLSLGKQPMLETSHVTAEDSSHTRSTAVTRRERRAEAVQAGMCTICLENRIDSLLYGCGHMATCVMCGRQLIASGQCCPICRAPVRDVVRAFMVTP